MGMEILLIGAMIVGLPIIIAGLVSYWRDRQYEKHSDAAASPRAGQPQHDDRLVDALFPSSDP